MTKLYPPCYPCNDVVREGSGVQGALCTSSMRFKHIEPHRTFLNYILTEIARYIDFFHTSSGWFDCTEPSPTTSLQGIQDEVRCAVREGSIRFDVLEPPRTGAYSTLHTLYPLKRCSWRRFGTVEPLRTRVKYTLLSL